MAAAVKQRESNIELFRIVLMLMIIAHHYVVNSGVEGLYDYSNVSGNQVFLELWGWGGKVGVNCFLLVTGYFMCRGHFTWRKFLRLYLEVKFYKLAIALIFVLAGRQALTAGYCFNTVFNVAVFMGTTFSTTFIALFLLVPFINRLVGVLDRRAHAWLVMTLLLIYTLVGTFFNRNFTGDIGWFVTVYLIGAYIGRYPMARMDSIGRTAAFAALAVIVSLASVMAITFAPQLAGRMNVYYFLTDANRIMAIVSAVALFLFFKNLPMRHNRLINLAATATFGVLLIHTHSDLSPWLWGDVLNVKGHFASHLLWLHAIAACAGIYLVCVIIDLLRQRLLERPLFNWLDTRFPSLNNPH